jgi:cell division septation protein DedD
MRDLRKLRPKYELKFDNKHVAYLLLAELVLAIIVFSLGVVVGKGMGQLDQAAKHAAEPAAPLARLPEKTPLAPPETPRTVDAWLHDDESPTPIPVTAPFEPYMPSPTPPPAAIRSDQPSAADLATALPAGAGKVEIGSLPTAPKGGDYWTVQVGSYPTKEEAQAMVDRLNQTGNQPHVETAELGEKGTWYRVSVGQYATEAGARAMADALRQREKIDTWVRYVP